MAEKKDEIQNSNLNTKRLRSDRGLSPPNCNIHSNGSISCLHLLELCHDGTAVTLWQCVIYPRGLSATQCITMVSCEAYGCITHSRPGTLGHMNTQSNKTFTNGKWQNFLSKCKRVNAVNFSMMLD